VTRKKTQRGRRVDEVLRQVVAETITKMGDPRLKLVTITGVEATPDTAYADVFIQVHGSERRRERAFEALEHVRPMLQQRVNEELHLRRTPVLRFQYDPSYDRGMRIEALLRDHEPPREEPEGGEE
jgi:ribosome-binding factor A